jgi:Methyltransferase domain
MLQLLRGVSTDGIDKIVTFDKDSSELTASMIPSKINLCFIDGEHTNAAVQRDFWFCESVLSAPGVIFFHDSDIVFEGIDNILQSLRTAGRPFHAYNLPTMIFVIDLGMNIHEDENIRNLLAENHLGYIGSLKTMAPYRKFYNKKSIRLLRRAYQFFEPTR